MTASGIDVPQAYAEVLLAATLISLELVIIGMVVVGGARKKTGLKYPDCGNGRFSQKLSDTQWESFANAQRAHLNFVEGAVPITVVLLVAGLFQPWLAARLGLTYAVGRALYAAGYASQGQKGRLVGVLVLDVALVWLAGIAILGSGRAAGWF